MSAAAQQQRLMQLLTPANFAAAAEALDEPDTEERLALRVGGFVRALLQLVS
jgi:hypothetical protein